MGRQWQATPACLARCVGTPTLQQRLAWCRDCALGALPGWCPSDAQAGCPAGYLGAGRGGPSRIGWPRATADPPRAALRCVAFKVAFNDGGRRSKTVAAVVEVVLAETWGGESRL